MKLLKIILVIAVGIGIVFAINFLSKTGGEETAQPEQESRYAEISNKITQEWSKINGWDKSLNNFWLNDLAEEQFNQRITTSQHDSLIVRLRLAEFNSITPKLDSLMKASSWNPSVVDEQFQGIDTVNGIPSLATDIKRFKDIKSLYGTCNNTLSGLKTCSTGAVLFARHGAFSGNSWASFDQSVAKVKDNVNSLKKSKYYDEYMDNKFTNSFETELKRLPSLREGYYSSLLNKIKDTYAKPENNYNRAYADLKTKLENATSEESRNSIKSQMESLRKESDRELSRCKQGSMTLFKIKEKLGHEHRASSSSLGAYIKEYNDKVNSFFIK